MELSNLSELWQNMSNGRIYKCPHIIEVCDDEEFSKKIQNSAPLLCQFDLFNIINCLCSFIELDDIFYIKIFFKHISSDILSFRIKYDGNIIYSLDHIIEVLKVIMNFSGNVFVDKIYDYNDSHPLIEVELNGSVLLFMQDNNDLKMIDYTPCGALNNVLSFNIRTDLLFIPSFIYKIVLNTLFRPKYSICIIYNNKYLLANLPYRYCTNYFDSISSRFHDFMSIFSHECNNTILEDYYEDYTMSLEIYSKIGLVINKKKSRIYIYYFLNGNLQDPDSYFLIDFISQLHLPFTIIPRKRKDVKRINNYPYCLSGYLLGKMGYNIVLIINTNRSDVTKFAIGVTENLFRKLFTIHPNLLCDLRKRVRYDGLFSTFQIIQNSLSIINNGQVPDTIWNSLSNIIIKKKEIIDEQS